MDDNERERLEKLAEQKRLDDELMQSEAEIYYRANPSATSADFAAAWPGIRARLFEERYKRARTNVAKSWADLRYGDVPARLDRLHRESIERNRQLGAHAPDFVGSATKTRTSGS